MTRDHFKQVYTSPYFQSDYYKNETKNGITEKKVEAFLLKIKKYLALTKQKKA